MPCGHGLADPGPHTGGGGPVVGKVGSDAGRGRGLCLSLVLVADLSHYEGADPTQHPAAFRLAERLRAIVQAGTAVPAGDPFDSTLRCHRRPGRRSCQGHLVLVRHEVPAEIVWRCSACGDDGIVRGWELSPWDLRGPRSKEGPRASLEVTETELGLLRALEMLDLDCQRVVHGASWDRGKLWLTASVDDLEDLAGLVAFAAGHESNRRRQRQLEELLGRLEGELAAP